MSTLTRKAIMHACVRLLEERPVDKITVKDIVEACGINRNTFYYHFADLPTLISAIMQEAVERVIQEKYDGNSLWDCLEHAIHLALTHRRAVLHIYQSSNRAELERHLFQLCQSAVTRYVDKVCRDMPEVIVHADDRRIVIQAYACESAGQIIHWLSGSMKDDFAGDMIRLCRLREGMTRTMLERSAQP
ncbi:MAG: TetR/AcrR family transcriptional regulator [Aristaeellaceae bacterium]